MHFIQPHFIESPARTVGVLGVSLVLAAGCSALGSERVADVLQAERDTPGTVSLLVGACNQEPFVDELEQTAPGTYEVLVRTELKSNGDECADLVSIAVDPDHEALTVVDRVSGETFEMFGSGEPAPLGLNGVWEMRTVDSRSVRAGGNTETIPEITISATEESAVLSGNFGCNDQSIEVTFEGETLIGRPDTLEGTEEFCSIPDGSNELVLTERTLLELLSGEPVSARLSGDRLTIGNGDTDSVFERVAAV